MNWEASSIPPKRLVSGSSLIGTEKDKQAYLATFANSTHLALTLHLQADPKDVAAAQLALTTVLRRKGRILDTLGQRAHLLRQRLHPKLHAEFDQFVALRSQVARLTFQPNLTASERQQQIDALTPQIQILEASLSRQSATFQQLHQPVTLSVVQAAIPNNAALVEFIRYTPLRSQADASGNAQTAAPLHSSPTIETDQDHYAIYVVRHNGQLHWADLGRAIEVDALVRSFRRSVTDVRRPTSIKPIAQTLKNRLFQSVDAALTDVDHLIIAPDSQLNLIPFAALVHASDQYLVETHEITYLTSGRDLIRNPDTPGQPQQSLIIANPSFQPLNFKANLPTNSFDLKFIPLPGTAAEASAILPLIATTHLLTGQQATETKLKQTSNPHILHLATHGFFLKPPSLVLSSQHRRIQHPQIQNPLLRSGLALADVDVSKRDQDDGILTALEVAGLDFRDTQLVVLSACETGLGDIADGEGVYGLRRAFTLAGAHSQLTSLWKVSDQGTKDLMVHYYQNLDTGSGRGKALQQVQRAMLHHQIVGQDPTSSSQITYEHPFYWAAFIPTGDWRPLEIASP